jgi:chromosome segregation ATPase
MKELRERLDSLAQKIALKEAELLDLKNEVYTIRAIINAAIDEQAKLDEESAKRSEQDAIRNAAEMARQALEERKQREQQEAEQAAQREARERAEQLAQQQAINEQTETERLAAEEAKAKEEAAEQLRAAEAKAAQESREREAELVARLKAEKEAEEEQQRALELQKAKRVPEQDHEAIMRTIEEMSRSVSGIDKKTAADQFSDKPTLGDKVSRSRLHDIKKAIGLNERFLYANELFGGDMRAFKQAVDELNHVDSESDANRLLDEELADKYHWNEEDETVIAFKSLVSRRFV